MKTIKIIDLLNKIANGEEVPNKIKFEERIWEKAEGGKNKVYYTNYSYYDLFIYILRNNNTYSLNDEVKIIEEEKEIEKIKSNGIDFYSDCINVWINKEETVAYCEFLMNKVNEVIDAVNEMRKEK